MALLLSIDTATETASVCLTNYGSSPALLQNENQKEHASFIHTAIAEILKSSGLQLTDIDAFAVTSGPGSYTGLRVSMAAAKGFCYALSKPLITINTLEAMTKAAIDNNEHLSTNLLFCPMIDARRMEVFTAVYDAGIKCVLSPRATILQKDLFDEYLANNKIVFFGSGSAKYKSRLSNANAVFSEVRYNACHLAQLAEEAFGIKKFSNISYAEPTYFKNFHSIVKS